MLSIDLRRQAPCLENVTTGKPLGAAAELVHRPNDPGPNHAIEDLFDDLNGDVVGHTESVYKSRCLTCFAHALRDRFASTMHENRIDSDRFKKNHIFQKTFNEMVIL